MEFENQSFNLKLPESQMSFWHYVKLVQKLLFVL